MADVTEFDGEFTPSGAYWTWPLWRKALALATLRPFCLVLGYLAVVRQWVALRAPNKPFRPMAWVHTEPCDDEWCNGHDEPGLEYERHLDVPRDFADDFDIRVGRMYKWNHPASEKMIA